MHSSGCHVDFFPSFGADSLSLRWCPRCGSAFCESLLFLLLLFGCWFQGFPALANNHAGKSISPLLRSHRVTTLLGEAIQTCSTASFGISAKSDSGDVYCSALHLHPFFSISLTHNRMGMPVRLWQNIDIMRMWEVFGCASMRWEARAFPAACPVMWPGIPDFLVCWHRAEGEFWSFPKCHCQDSRRFCAASPRTRTSLGMRHMRTWFSSLSFVCGHDFDHHCLYKIMSSFTSVCIRSCLSLPILFVWGCIYAKCTIWFTEIYWGFPVSKCIDPGGAGSHDEHCKSSTRGQMGTFDFGTTGRLRCLTGIFYH